MTPLTFSVVGANVAPDAIAPTIVLRMHVHAEGATIDALALRVRVQIEPWRRTYEANERAMLGDLSLRSPVQFAEVSVMIGGCAGDADFDLPILCTYDAAVAATKYAAALSDGDVPLRLFFNGTLFRGGVVGFSVEMLPWNLECETLLPAQLWHVAMQACFDRSPWIRVDRETYDALLKYKAHNHLRDWDAVMSHLMEAKETA